MWAFQSTSADRKMHGALLQGFLLLGAAQTCTYKDHLLQRLTVHSLLLFRRRETTSGVRSWSSLQRPRSTTGIRSSPALCPNSRWESIILLSDQTNINICLLYFLLTSLTHSSFSSVNHLRANTVIRDENICPLGGSIVILFRQRHDC